MLERLLADLWTTLNTFWNSNFGTAVISAFIGSLAGAWGGALAAERIAEKRRVREQLLKEINQTNAAIELSHTICSSYLNLKEQHVRGVWEDYQRKREQVHDLHERQRHGAMAPRTVPTIQLDQRTLDVVRAKIEHLEGLVLGELSLRGRPRPLVAILSQTRDSLNNSITLRNQLIVSARTLDDNAKVAFYFGLPTEGGVDDTFGNVLEAVHRQTDDCIYFSWRLCEDLTRHGKRVREQFGRRFKGPVSRIQTVLWTDVVAKGLLPPLGAYRSWEEGFLERVPATGRRRLAKWWYAVRKAERRLFLRPWGRWRKQQKFRK
jgi:hypothetical protein